MSSWNSIFQKEIVGGGQSCLVCPSLHCPPSAVHHPRTGLPADYSILWRHHLHFTMAPLFQKNAFDYITLLDDYHVSAHPFQVLPLILIIYSAVYHSISMKQIPFCSGDSILSKVFWVQSHASDRSTAKKNRNCEQSRKMATLHGDIFFGINLTVYGSISVKQILFDSGDSTLSKVF